MTEYQTTEQASETMRQTASESRRLAGIAFIALSAQFMTVIMLAAAMAPNYDFNAGAISDLGVFSETALLFNASLVVVGVLNLAGGYVLYRGHGKRWLLGVFAVAGLGAVGTGLFPLDAGDLHSLFALLAFVFFNVEALAVATQVDGVMRALSALAGLLGLAFVVVMVIGDSGTTAAFGPIGHGGAERMIVYPAMLWLVAYGGYLLGASDTPAQTVAPTE